MLLFWYAIDDGIESYSITSQISFEYDSDTFFTLLSRGKWPILKYPDRQFSYPFEHITFKDFIPDDCSNVAKWMLICHFVTCSKVAVDINLKGKLSFVILTTRVWGQLTQYNQQDGPRSWQTYQWCYQV